MFLWCPPFAPKNMVSPPRRLAALAQPPVTRVARRPAHREVLPAHPRQLVVHRESRELHRLPERQGDEGSVVRRHRVVAAVATSLVLAGIRLIGQAAVHVPDPVETRVVETDDLPLGGLGQLRVSPLLPRAPRKRRTVPVDAREPVRDLEPPERLDLPLRRPVPDGVGAEYDAILAEVLERLAEQVGANAGERDHAGGEGGAQLRVYVPERRRRLQELRGP